MYFSSPTWDKKGNKMIGHVEVHQVCSTWGDSRSHRTPRPFTANLTHCHTCSTATGMMHVLFSRVYPEVFTESRDESTTRSPYALHFLDPLWRIQWKVALDRYVTNVARYGISASTKYCRCICTHIAYPRKGNISWSLTRIPGKRSRERLEVNVIRACGPFIILRRWVKNESSKKNMHLLLRIVAHLAVPSARSPRAVFHHERQRSLYSLSFILI